MIARMRMMIVSFLTITCCLNTHTASTDIDIKLKTLQHNLTLFVEKIPLVNIVKSLDKLLKYIENSKVDADLKIILKKNELIMIFIHKLLAYIALFNSLEAPIPGFGHLKNDHNPVLFFDAFKTAKDHNFPGFDAQSKKLWHDIALAIDNKWLEVETFQRAAGRVPPARTTEQDASLLKWMQDAIKETKRIMDFTPEFLAKTYSNDKAKALGEIAFALNALDKKKLITYVYEEDSDAESELTAKRNELRSLVAQMIEKQTLLSLPGPDQPSETITLIPEHLDKIIAEARKVLEFRADFLSRMFAGNKGKIRESIIENTPLSFPLQQGLKLYMSEADNDKTSKLAQKREEFNDLLEQIVQKRDQIAPSGETAKLLDMINSTLTNARRILAKDKPDLYDFYKGDALQMLRNIRPLLTDPKEYAPLATYMQQSDGNSDSELVKKRQELWDVIHQIIKKRDSK